MRRLLTNSGLLALSLLLCGYKVRCNKEQTECEVDTKRLTAGDHVAIVDEDSHLVALGTVTGLKGRVRTVRIDKKFGSILRSHELDLITDEQYNDPSQFKTSKPIAEKSAGVSLGLIAVGVGEGLLGFDGEGYYEMLWKNGIYFVGRGYFVHASGEASITGNEIQSLAVSMNALGGLGGLSYTLFPTSDVAFRGEVGLGFSYVSAAVGGGGDVKKTVDNRVAPGAGLGLRGEVGAIFRAGTMRPFATSSVFLIQRSLNFGLAVGLAFAL